MITKLSSHSFRFLSVCCFSGNFCSELVLDRHHCKTKDQIKKSPTKPQQKNPMLLRWFVLLYFGFVCLFLF